MSESVPVTAGLFRVGADGAPRLVGGWCPACAHWHFPASANCPYCSAEGCTTRELSPRGTLCLFTRVANRPPGYLGEVPFGFGVVELPEGLRLIARLSEADVDRLRLGMPVQLVIVPLHTDDAGCQVMTYAFAPLGEAAP